VRGRTEGQDEPERSMLMMVFMKRLKDFCLLSRIFDKHVFDPTQKSQSKMGWHLFPGLFRGEELLYFAPVPIITAGMVLTSILVSSHKDQLSIYSKSIFIHFSKLMLFLPLTCQRQVSPGFMESFLLCQ
jgi:hypothetical protein